MSNEVKKNENDGFRKIQATLNELNRIVTDKNDVAEEVPQANLVSQYYQQSLPAVIEDEEFSDLCEQAAALQYSEQNKDQICKALSIDSKKYKEIVSCQDFINIKKRLAEDQKVNILAQTLGLVKSAMSTLSELMETADEDKVRLNAAAIVLEQASKLLEEQKVSLPDFNSALREATRDNEPVQVTLAQVILQQRKARGLSG